MSPALYGWITQGLLVAALVACIRPRPHWLLICLAFCLSFMPLPEIGNLAAWLHGVFSTPSVPLIVLALRVCLDRPIPITPSLPAGVLLTGLAAAFYATALGLGPIDPYGWGFHPQILLLPLGILMVILYGYGHALWLWILILSLVAYTLGIYSNLWDALFDPILIVILAYTLFKRPAGKNPS